MTVPLETTELNGTVVFSVEYFSGGTFRGPRLNFSYAGMLEMKGAEALQFARHLTGRYT
jgi:hypothetical protein